MALIESDRYSSSDLRAWRRAALLDTLLATSGAMRRLEDAAILAIKHFASQGPCYASISWGKDSVVLADLAFRATPMIPLVWFPAGDVENPDCYRVRDIFLDAHPGAGYREIVATLDESITVDGHDGAQAAFARASRLVCSGRYLSGIRAEESSGRRKRVLSGDTTRSCAPIGRWSAKHVFAYLAKYDLPIHPAYACTMGGILDRGQIRVATIGGIAGTGRGRREWERRYYPELIAAQKEQL